MTALIIYSSLKEKLKERQLNSLFLWLMVKWYLSIMWQCLVLCIPST